MCARGWAAHPVAGACAAGAPVAQRRGGQEGAAPGRGGHAGALAQRVGPPVTPIGEQACRLHSHADTLEWLAFRLILADCEFEVHQPPELAGYLRMLGARLTRAAGTEPQPPD